MSSKSCGTERLHGLLCKSGRICLRKCGKPHIFIFWVLGDQEIEFVITIKEFKPGADQSMRFLAQADKQTNQKTAPYLPSGWGSNLLQALSACIKEIKRFPYEG